MVSWIWTLLTMPALGSPECGWLLWCTGFGPCSQCLSLALQFVSGFHGELHFYPAHNTCPWLSSLCYEHRPLGKCFKRHVTVGITPDRFKRVTSHLTGDRNTLTNTRYSGT